MPGGGPAAVYAERRAAHAAELARLRALSHRFSLLRALTFVAAFALVVWAVWPGLDGGAPAGAGSALAFAAFVALVIRHERLERRIRWTGALADVADEALARLERRWDALPLPPMPTPHPEHPFAHDLDVVGRASLLHLLGGLAGAWGRATLGRWLLAEAPPATAETVERQDAVAELAPEVATRESLAAHGRLAPPLTEAALARFGGWAESAPWLTAARWRMPLVHAVTAAILLLVGLHAAGVLDRPLWLLPMIVGWALTARWRRETHARFDAADPGRALAEHYPAVLDLVHAREFRAARLRALQAATRAGTAAGGASESAADALRRLARLSAISDARHMYLHFVVQSLTLWDFHALAALERWQRAAGPHVRGWLAALGEFEALAALSSLTHDHPAWCRPVVDPARTTLEARDLAHPLLPPAAAVGNDVELGPPGRLLFVTGSNMSGKSTLLRAIGINAVLAQTGAAACAAGLALPPLAPVTSLRVSDSLAAGVSYFLAELRRLKLVVDRAEAGDSTTGAPRALFLLDEILQGTNPAERQIAAQQVLLRLLRSPAVGAVTTHDLGVAEHPVLAGALVLVHFEEQVDERDRDAPMTFDHRLRPGFARSTNALRLLRMTGLYADDDRTHP